MIGLVKQNHTDIAFHEWAQRTQHAKGKQGVLRRTRTQVCGGVNPIRPEAGSMCNAATAAMVTAA